ncbi:Cuticle protein 6 [Frankliniella fusca]|uniref:Cuticle protein 6 n=1 Tax=Frankliniella fusca TaxID=407009 RepID=A0AAE1H570_9NEOP|nr:Cuticle protein 6 [Frankliniella fusca]
MRKTAVLLLVALQVLAVLASPYGGVPAPGPAADYTYSYSSGVAAGHEARAGSLTHGGFSYVDANGQEPVRETPEVARARQEHLEAVARAKALVAGAAGLHPQGLHHQHQADTPEVAAARAHHLAIVQDAHARAGVAVTPAPPTSWSTPGVALYAVSSTPAPVQDTVEVAAAKAKHLAAVEEAKARVAAAAAASSGAGASAYHQSYSASSSYSQQHQQHQQTHSAYSAVQDNLPVQDTAEVAAAKAQHLAAVAQAAARVSSTNSIATHFVAPPALATAAPSFARFHYPNVPGELSRFPAPAPAPIAAPAAWPSVAVRYNTIAAVEDASGRYVPDDEGQYDPRLDAEGQYDPRLDAEGQYVPSLNDEGQWTPSANEGQYIPGREDQSGEDNMPYSYSYSDGLSSKTETKTADGVTRGRFSYVDANGVLQGLEYEADNVHGFRASGTNLPQAPAPAASSYQPAGVPAYRAPVAAYGVPSLPPRPIAASYAAVPVPDVPADTPEVAAAKAAHFAAHREAGARLASAYAG